jgi:hypothetical protein
LNSPARQLSASHDISAKLAQRLQTGARLALERVLAGERVQRIQPSAEQTAMLARIRRVLGPAGRRPGRVRRSRRTSGS